MMPVYAAESRYEPRPLIDDKAVATHSFRGGREETRIFSVTTASTEPIDVDTREADFGFDRYRLVSDMEIVEKCNGQTSLHVLTYTTEDNELAETIEEFDLTIRIRRHTTFCFARVRVSRASMYQLSMDDLDALKSPNRLWQKNFADLVEQRSDLAYLHVNRNLKGLRAPQPSNDWMKPRQPDYEKVLKEVAIISEPSSDGEEERCHICLEALHSIKEVVQLQCHGKHEFHLECLVLICESSGPEKSRCPLCRDDLIKKATDMEFLKYCVKNKAYIFNP